MSGYMAAYRFMRTYSEGTDPAVMIYFRRRIDDLLGIIEKQLRGRPFVAGVDVTVADISMCAYLSYPAYHVSTRADFQRENQWRTLTDIETGRKRRGGAR